MKRAYWLGCILLVLAASCAPGIRAEGQLGSLPLPECESGRSLAVNEKPWHPASVADPRVSCSIPVVHESCAAQVEVGMNQEQVESAIGASLGCSGEFRKVSVHTISGQRLEMALRFSPDGLVTDTSVKEQPASPPGISRGYVGLPPSDGRRPVVCAQRVLPAAELVV